MSLDHGCSTPCNQRTKPTLKTSEGDQVPVGKQTGKKVVDLGNRRGTAHIKQDNSLNNVSQAIPKERFSSLGGGGLLCHYQVSWRMCWHGGGGHRSATGWRRRGGGTCRNRVGSWRGDGGDVELLIPRCGKCSKSFVRDLNTKCETAQVYVSHAHPCRTARSKLMGTSFSNCP